MNQQGVNIKITTQAELSALQATESALVKQYVAAKTLGQEYKNLERDLEKVQQRISAVKALPPPPAPPKASFGQRLGDATKEAIQEIPVVGAFSRAFNGALPLVGAGLLVIKKGFDLAGEAIHEFAAKQAEMAKLDAALANSGQLTEGYRAKLEELAKERAGATGVSHEKYFSTFATLTKFGADSSNIDQYTHAVENLAGFLNGDMDQAAFFFGKAMQGSTTMLTRYGIHVDSAKSNTEQLADIMRQLEARGGGQLEALGNTLEGSFAKVKNSWGEMLAGMGSLADKSGLAKFMANWAVGAQAIADKMGGGPKTLSTNREELIATDPANQEAVDKIAIQRRDLKTDKARRIEESRSDFKNLQGFKGGDETPLFGESKAAIENRLNANANIIDQINASLAELDRKEKALGGVRHVTPGEADREREIEALRHGSELLAPAGSPEDIAAAAAAAKTNAEKREELELQLQISEAAASGNKEQEQKLKWQQDYNKLLKENLAAQNPDAWNDAIRGANAATTTTKPETFQHAAPLTDRLSQIGGYNSPSQVRADRSMSNIEDATKRTAAAVEEIAKKPDPTHPPTTPF